MQQTLKWSMFIAATAGVVYLCTLMLQPFLLVIAWSVVLAILFHPLHQRIARKTNHATLSALMTSALVVLDEHAAGHWRDRRLGAWSDLPDRHRILGTRHRAR